MDFLKGNLWPMGDYPNLLGITPADRMPKKIVYIKTPMRLEDFDMTFSEDFIRSNIQVYTMRDALTKDFNITASFKLSDGPEFKATGVVFYYTAIFEKDAVQNMKNELSDELVRRVKTYYEEKDVKENMMNMNMHAVNDEICNYQGLLTKAPTPYNKSKWIEGLPTVKKVEIYNGRVVKVTFVDDTFTKSVCSENDIFDLDVGITICAMKRLLGTSSENATREYNRFMKDIHAVMERDIREKAKAKAQKEATKAKKRKTELKRAAKALKAKEEKIDIYKQAILRAQKETFSQFEDGGSI